MIYTTLNKCIIRDTFVDGQVWIPVNLVNEVSNNLQNLFKGNEENKTSAYLEDLPLDDDIRPPTLIHSNEFTSAFQLVVDTYGIPRYREINPGYFSIITFPFLFGVMFGDIGHGMALFLFAIYLCLFNNRISKSKSILKQLLFARYFFLLMGFFAVYCGLLYNDFLSIPIDPGSCYKYEKGTKKSTVIKQKDSNCNYKFGIDPIWYLSTNELAFINSLKMKLSVILGVFQMVIGIILKGLNAFFEKDFVELVFIFIPQLILMLVLFGYMDFLIFVKWATYYEIEIIDGYEINYNYVAPDIKSYLMNIILKTGSLPNKPNPPYFDGKTIETKDKDWRLLADRNTLEKIHAGILICSAFCIIIMLLPKILINYGKAKKKANMNKNNNIINEENQEFKEELVNPQREIQEPAISDFIVASAIETIEFVLGTVSNTASYLRLWALSLAHSQLALVFFQKTIGSLGTLSDSMFLKGILLIFAVPFFTGVTSIVLLFMDMMECFLHTLRLHWVEFQNKFYRADGYQFKPFCFSQNLSLNDDEFLE